MGPKTSKHSLMTCEEKNVTGWLGLKCQDGGIPLTSFDHRDQRWRETTVTVYLISFLTITGVFSMGTEIIIILHYSQNILSSHSVVKTG